MIEALAPIATAIVRRATIEKPGFFQRVLQPNLKSWSNSLNLLARCAVLDDISRGTLCRTFLKSSAAYRAARPDSDATIT